MSDPITLLPSFLAPNDGDDPDKPFVSRVPHHDIVFRTTSQILARLPTLVPAWFDPPPAHAPILEPITGGLSNRMYKATLPYSNHTPVIIRLFGAKQLISREQRAEETLIFEQLARADLAPSLISVFRNGRVEAFLPCRPLTLPEMTHPHVLTGVGSFLARLHTFRPHGVTNPTPRIWDDIERWASKAIQLNRKKAFPSLFGLDLVACVQGLQQTKHLLLYECPDSPVVFCHNDALHGNILLSVEDGRSIRLIDFEYSSFNYRGFDIASFFIEAMGGTDDGYMDESRYPTAEARWDFCEAYLIESLGYRPSHDEIFSLVKEAQRYGLIACLYWGFWGLVQSVSSTVSFPYVLFAEQRFSQFFKRRPV